MAELWNVAQVCKYLGVSRATVYRLMQRNRLPEPIKAIGAPRWDAEELKKFLKLSQGVSSCLTHD